MAGRHLKYLAAVKLLILKALVHVTGNNTMTLVEYLTKKYFSKVEDQKSTEKRLVSEVLTLNAKQLVSMSDQIDHIRWNIKWLLDDILAHFSSGELYQFLKDNLDHFKQSPDRYRFKETILKRHPHMYNDFKALYYVFVD